jgi:hypothetical protein
VASTRSWNSAARADGWGTLVGPGPGPVDAVGAGVADGVGAGVADGVGAGVADGVGAGVADGVGAGVADGVAGGVISKPASWISPGADPIAVTSCAGRGPDRSSARMPSREASIRASCHTRIARTIATADSSATATRASQLDLATFTLAPSLPSLTSLCRRYWGRLPAAYARPDRPSSRCS